MGRTGPLRRIEPRASVRVTVAASLTLTLAAALAGCSSEPEEDPSGSTDVVMGDIEPQRPVGEEIVADDGQMASAAPSESPTEQSPPATTRIDGTGEDDIPTEAPEGMSEEEWTEAWWDAAGVARDYVRHRYQLSYEEYPDKWQEDVAPYVTAGYLEQLKAGPSQAGEWESYIVDQEIEFHVQTLGTPMLSLQHPFGPQEMVIAVPYRTWEQSSLAPRPPFDTDDAEFGAEGQKWANLEMSNVDGRWLVASEDRVQVSGLFD